MTNEPLISSEVFDYLRHLGIAPYTKLNDAAREQLGDGVRLIALFAGDSFITHKAGLRITTISGKVRLEPSSACCRFVMRWPSSACRWSMSCRRSS
jgi:hypothetical protein